MSTRKAFVAGAVSAVSFIVLLWLSAFALLGMLSLLAAVPMTWALGVTGRAFDFRVGLAVVGIVAGVGTTFAAGAATQSLYLGIGSGAMVASTIPLMAGGAPGRVVALDVAGVGFAALLEGVAGDASQGSGASAVFLIGMASLWGAQFAVSAGQGASVPATGGR